MQHTQTLKLERISRAQVRMENQKDLSLTATAAEQLVELGTAADFGFCQSNRKVTHAPQMHDFRFMKCAFPA